MKILVTGAAGFIGSNYVQFVLKEYDDEVVSLDALTYAGNLQNLASVSEDPRHRFVHGDIRDRDVVDELVGEVDAVVHFAAESHVDRSIQDATPFIDTNVAGTTVLLDAALRHKVRYLQVSTDEVYGSLGAEGLFSETTPIAPNSPYAASKASADLLVRAYHHTHKLETLITRCSNNYGPYQFPEKLIPLMISNASQDEALPVYGDGMQVRDWIHVTDHVKAVDLVLRKGKPGEVYNIGGDAEKPNIEIVRTILSALGKSEDLIRYVQDRPGHDRRYAIDFTKIERELGWRPEVGFAEGIADTIQWYQNNGPWLDGIKTGAYRGYIDAMYGERLRSSVQA